MSRLTQLWVIVAASAAAGGCATTEPNKPARAEMPVVGAPAPVPSACAGNVLQVKVRDIRLVSSTLLTIKVPRQVKIGANRAGANWTLVTPGYVFAPTGVVIESGPTSPTGSFSNGTDQYGLCFDSAPGSTWKYSLLLRATSGSVIWRCDPTIVNLGGNIASTLDEDPLSCQQLTQGS